MKTIYKYHLDILDRQEIMMPKNAKVLSTKMMLYTGLFIWAEVDTDKPGIARVFKVFGTGSPMYNKTKSDIFLGTVFEGAFVWHIYVEEK